MAEKDDTLSGKPNVGPKRYRPSFVVALVSLGSLLEGGIACILGWLLFDSCTQADCLILRPFGATIALGGALMVALSAAIVLGQTERRHLPYLAVGNILFGGFWVGLLLTDFINSVPIASLTLLSVFHFFVVDVIAPMVLALICVKVLVSSHRVAAETIHRR